MKKDTIRAIFSLAVMLVLYLLIVFLVPFVHTATFWVSFGFTLIAFGVAAESIYIALIRNPDARSKFYGFPIAKIGAIYGLVQLVLGFAAMALGAFVPVWAAVLVFAIALGAAAIGLISADAAAEEIQRQDGKLKKDVAFLRELQSRANRLASQCDLPEVKQFAEDVRYADPVSNEALAEIEQELSAAVEELQTAVTAGSTAAVAPLCRKASSLLAERNRLCKLNKR